MSSPVPAQNAALNASTRPQSICEHCSIPYHQAKKYQRFCGYDCRMAFHRGKGKIEARVTDLERRVAALESK